MIDGHWTLDLLKGEDAKNKAHMRWNYCALSSPWMQPLEHIPDRLISETILIVYEQAGERHICTGLATHQDDITRWYRHGRDEIERPLLWSDTHSLMETAAAALDNLPDGA